MRRNYLIVILLMFGAVTYAQNASPNTTALLVRLPDQPWAVVVGSPGFVVEKNETKPDGRQYLLASNKSSGITLSITLERSTGADAKKCPDFLRQRVQGLSGLKLTNVRYSSSGSMSLVEYVIPDMQGYPIRQGNVVACSAKEDAYIDVHLSKTQFKPEDDGLFTAVIQSVQISDTAAPAQIAAADQHDSRYYMALGSRYYMQQQYDKAIQPYRSALELEKQNPKLDHNLWRALVDNLGMSYGITGDLNNAEAVFRYGLSKDPTYPMFSYNMACVYGERNDLDNTIAYLKKAFEYRANSIPGEGMPDPRKDDSFQRFLNNPKFQAAVDALPKN